MPTNDNTSNAVNYHRPTEAEAVAKIARENNEPKIVSLAVGDQHAQVLVVSKDHEVREIKPYLDKYLKAPERRRGTASLGDLRSFIAHANRFKDEDSALFASPDADLPSLTSVLDYHEAGGDGSPRWGEHRGVYTFPLSDEWRAWTAQNAKPMPQAEFAAFLEKRLIDVKQPTADLTGLALELAQSLDVDYASPRRLLELSRGLTVHETSRVTNALSLSTGEANITFQTEHETRDGEGVSVKVPKGFLIAIPVFRAGLGYVLPVLLRYRKQGGSLVWHYEIQGADRAFQNAFDEACDAAVKQTGLPLFVGKPEIRREQP